MTGSTIIFYLLALLTLLSAVGAVCSRQLFRSAIYLLFTLVGIACLYFWMQYEFIGAVQIVVYVGGITVLIIFSIFLTQQAGTALPLPRRRQQLFAALAALCAFGLIISQLAKYLFTPTTGPRLEPLVATIGERMLSTSADGYALPFELVSVLLLVALVGCIAIAIAPGTASANTSNSIQA